MQPIKIYFQDGISEHIVNLERGSKVTVCMQLRDDDHIAKLTKESEAKVIMHPNDVYAGEVVVSGLVGEIEVVGLQSTMILYCEDPVASMLTSLAGYESQIVLICENGSISQSVSICGTCSIIAECEASDISQIQSVQTNPSEMTYSCNSPVLIRVVLSTVADWSDYAISDLSELSTLSMIYTEV